MHSVHEFDDYIGTESCVDLEPHVERDSTAPSLGGAANANRRRIQTEKEYPSSIPRLAGSETPPSHTPWVMKKHYTGDGRLIITEEKVKRQEYFQANRSEGRLKLKLVPVNEAVECGGEAEEEKLDAGGGGNRGRSCFGVG